MRKISLTEKLVLYFLLTGLFSVVCVSWYAYYSGQKAIISRTFDQLTSVRVVKQSLVEKYFSDARFNLKLLAASSQIITLAADGFRAEGRKSPDLSMVDCNNSGRSFFTQSILDNSVIDALFILCSNGDILEISKDSLNDKLTIGKLYGDDEITIRNLEDFARQFLKGNQTLIHTHDSTSVFMASTIDGNGIGNAMLIMKLDIKPVFKIMVENIMSKGWGITGESYIVDDQLFMRTPSRFIEKSVLKTIANTEAVRRAFANRPGTAIVKDYRNIEVLSSFSKLETDGLSWCIMVEIDLNEAMSPVIKLRNEIMFLSIFIALIVFFLALYFSKSISRPIINLKKASEQIRNGNYNINVSIDSEDEIGELTRTFSAMADQIRQHTQMRINGEDTERRRLSRELHDGLGQWLVAARYRLESTDCSRPESTMKNIDETKKMVDTILDELRKISNNLMPGTLREFGLKIAIQSLTRELSELTQIKFHTELSNIPDNFSTETQTYIFRIVQEALNNMVKHSMCTEARLTTQIDVNHLIMIIQDNGKGFTAGEQMQVVGNGLRNMAERCQILGGDLKIQSNPGFGTTITISIPLNQTSL